MLIVGVKDLSFCLRVGPTVIRLQRGAPYRYRSKSDVTLRHVKNETGEAERETDHDRVREGPPSDAESDLFYTCARGLSSDPYDDRSPLLELRKVSRDPGTRLAQVVLTVVSRVGPSNRRPEPRATKYSATLRRDPLTWSRAPGFTAPTPSCLWFRVRHLSGNLSVSTLKIESSGPPSRPCPESWYGP